MRFLILIFLVAFSSMVSTHDWDWIKVANLTSGWDISKGKASVEIKGNEFIAKLY